MGLSRITQAQLPSFTTVFIIFINTLHKSSSITSTHNIYFPIEKRIIIKINHRITSPVIQNLTMIPQTFLHLKERKQYTTYARPFDWITWIAV